MSDDVELPALIPEHIRSKSAILRTDQGEFVAWSRSAALALLDALKGSTLAVGAGQVYNLTEHPPATVNGWFCERSRNESVIDYALRSRDLASSYLTIHRDSPIDIFMFVFDFDLQNVAA
jgi:hypothetical protein